MHGWASRGPPYPVYAPCTQGVGVPSKKNQEPSPLEDHLCAKD